MRNTSSGNQAVCTPAGDKVQCPGIGFNHVALRVLEPDYRARRCVYVQPVAGATVRLTYRAPLGRVLAGATGLHDYHQRKIAKGRVQHRGGLPGDVESDLVEKRHRADRETEPRHRGVDGVDGYPVL